jgi:hypothetical protein
MMEDETILRLNIERYRTILNSEKDRSTHRTIATLLAEAERQLREATAQGRPRRSD